MSAEEPNQLRELLRILAATPESIHLLIDRVPDEQVRRQPVGGEFSVLENICHLRDIETEGYTTRIRRILREDRPLLADIDGARLAIEREYNKQDVREALLAFALARTQNTVALSNVGPEELSREGTLEGVGAVKLEELLVMMSEHDASHLEDIERLIRSDKL